jgi:hypothetical protein
MKLIKVQKMTQNSGNWKYDIKGSLEYINPNYITRIIPENDDVYRLILIEETELVIDKSSFVNVIREIGV